MGNIFRKNFWIRNIGVIIIGFAVLFLFLPFILGSVVFVGNHDRFQYWLPMQMHYTEAMKGQADLTHFEGIFGGINTLALPSVFPNPGAVILAFLPADGFYYGCMILSALLFLIAGVLAFVFFKKTGAGSLASVTGTCCYLFSAGSVLRIQQSDLTFFILVAIPLLLLLVRRSFQNFSWVNALLQFLVLSLLAWFTFLQETAYVYLFVFCYAAYLSWKGRFLRPVLTTVLACLAGGVSALPRIWLIAQDVWTSKRLDDAAQYSFDQICKLQNIQPYEALRWFHEGIYGRFSSEAWCLGNNINLSEGCLLFASTLTPFLVIGIVGVAAATTFGKTNSAKVRKFRALWDERNGWFYTGVFAFCLSVILFKEMRHFLYLVFGKLDFTHTRILMIALLPQAVLVASAIDGLRVLCDVESLTKPTRSKSSFIGLGIGLFLAALVSLWWCYDPMKLSQFGKTFGKERTELQMEGVNLQPGTLWVRWWPRKSSERIIIEDDQNNGEWHKIGEAGPQTWQYTIRDMQYEPKTVRLSVKQPDGTLRVLGSSQVRKANFLTLRDIMLLKFPHLPVKIVEASVFHFFSTIILGGVLLCIFWAFKKQLFLRQMMLMVAAGFICGEIWSFAYFQLHGQHTRTTLPCYMGNHWYPSREEFSPPNAEEISWWWEKLETSRFRSIAVSNPDWFFGYHANGASMFLRGRFLDGYSSTVPARLSKLAWPEGVLGLRTINFTDVEQVKKTWPVLAQEKVKYAVVLKKKFYSRVAKPEDRAEIILNPLFLKENEMATENESPY